MFKLMRLIIVLAVVIGILYFFTAYQIVRLNEGYRVVKKDDVGFTAPVLDTRDWKVRDWLENPKIAKLKLDDVTDNIAEGWEDFKRSLDKWVKDVDTGSISDSAGKEFKRINKAIEEKYNDLNKRYKDGDINLDSFKEKLGQLRDWAEEQWADFRQKNLQE